MKNKAKRIVLGEGEIIGHKHILESPVDLDYEQAGNALEFELKAMGILTHDEHARMVFPAGMYRSYHQVEFNPFDQTVSRVFD